MPLPFLAGAAAVRGIVTAAKYMPKIAKAVGRGAKKVGKAAVSPGAIKGEIAFAGATEMKDAQAKKKKNKSSDGTQFKKDVRKQKKLMDEQFKKAQRRNQYQRKLGELARGRYQRKSGKVAEGSYRKVDKKKKK